MILLASAGWIAHWAAPACAQTGDAIRIVELCPLVEILQPGASDWTLAATNQTLNSFYRVRTGAHGSIGLLWPDHSVLRFGALTELEIQPPAAGDADHGLRLLRGILSFFHRGKPGRINIITSGAFAGIEGTEFIIEARASNGVEQTTLSVVDGVVRFTNTAGGLVLTNGQQAVAEPGKAPVRTAGFIAKNLLQWCFYYPGVLDLADLPLTPAEKAADADSLAAYRDGDLLAALGKYPETRRPGSEAERIYHAALLLGAGQVAEAEADLTAFATADSPEKSRSQRLAAALRTLIAAVKRDPRPSAAKPELPTELLADSYFEQSRAMPEVSLRAALSMAREAVAKSPGFAFAWERVAELEFSFGRVETASEALDRALVLSPRNAQALALKGFLLAAQNKTGTAIEWFDRALAVDSALGNGWLGRGLCRIRRGDLRGGREDLLIAAAMEPERASLRSYLAKAWSDSGEDPLAFKELQRAKALDPNDPMAWLYSALQDEQENRINEAVRDLEKSQELNTNRSVYRSGLLLGQDRAVSSANLARIYQEDGMDQVAVREAVRGVNADYASYSSHLFLANSYDALRDPNEVNLRYETAAESEYLAANLLAPVGAGPLSQTISQQEYSKMFDRDGLHLVSSTEFLSRGAWIESAAQYGTFGDSSYSLESYYRSDPGQRVNNDIQERQFSVQIKEQLAPQDTVYFKALDYNSDGGDLNEYYNQTNANPALRTQEKQEPILEAGYHREWTPGSHTLFLFSRLSDQINVSNPSQETFLIGRAPAGIDFVEPMSIAQNYQSTLEIYSMELQQIYQQPDHNTIAGGRFQFGDFHTRNLETNPSINVVAFLAPKTMQDFTTGFERLSFYGYHYWQVTESLLLEGGLTYDLVTFPDDFRDAPISNNKRTEEQFSPKAGLMWTPAAGTTVRAAYTRSMSGASFDQSYELEPSQMAGFVQSFRSILPESIGGAQAGARFETYSVSLEQVIRPGTYLGLSGQILNSTVDRAFGVFVANLAGGGNATPGGMQERIGYTERALDFTLDQLMGDGWSIGLHHHLDNALLEDNFPEVLANLPAGYLVAPFRANQHLTATLDQVRLHLNFNHRSGFFAQFESQWNDQINSGYSPAISGDDFWQFNVFAGYRSPLKRVELTVGVLNLTGQNYRLNPLTLYNEFARERTLWSRLRVNF